MRWLFLYCTREDVEWTYLVTKEGIKVHYWRFGLYFTIKMKAQKYFNEVFWAKKKKSRWCRRFLVDVKSSQRKNFCELANIFDEKKRKKVKELLRSIFELSFILESILRLQLRVGSSHISSFYYTSHHLRSACLYNLFIVSFMTTNEREKGYTRTSPRPISKVFCLPTKQRFNNKKEKISFNHHIS